MEINAVSALRTWNFERHVAHYPEDDIGVLILHSRIDLRLDQPPEPESIGLNAPPQRRPTARPLSDCLECFLPSNIINTICAGAPDHAKGGRCELLDPSHPSATGRHTNTSLYVHNIFRPAIAATPTASYHPSASAHIVPTDYRTLRQSA